MTTLLILIAVAALVVARAWFTDWPRVGNWGRSAWRDARRMQDRSARTLVGVEVPRNYEASVKAMKAAWPPLIRSHSMASPVEWVMDFASTCSGVDVQVALAADPALLEVDKQVLRDAHEQQVSFFAIEHDPADELYAALTTPAALPDDEAWMGRKDPERCEACSASPAEVLDQGDGFVCFRCPSCGECWTDFFTTEHEAQEEQAERFERAMNEADAYNRRHHLGPYARGLERPPQPREEEPWSEEPPEEPPLEPEGWGEGEPGEEPEEEEPWEDETWPEEFTSDGEDESEETAEHEQAAPEEPAPFEQEEIWREETPPAHREEPAEEAREEPGGANHDHSDYGDHDYGDSAVFFGG